MFLYIETALIWLTFVSFYCFWATQNLFVLSNSVTNLHSCFRFALVLQVCPRVTPVANLYPYYKLAHKYKNYTRVSNLHSCYKCTLLFQICTHGTNSIRPYDTNLHPCYKIAHMLKHYTSFLNLLSSFNLTFALQINRHKFEHHCFFQNRIL